MLLSIIIEDLKTELRIKLAFKSFYNSHRPIMSTQVDLNYKSLGNVLLKYKKA